MALTTQQANWLSRQQEEAQRLLDMRDRLERDIAMYNAEGFGADITDADIVASAEIYPALAHLTQSDMWNVVTAFTAVLDALGDDVSGQAVNLIKMRS